MRSSPVWVVSKISRAVVLGHRPGDEHAPAQRVDVANPQGSHGRMFTSVALTGEAAASWMFRHSCSAASLMFRPVAGWSGSTLTGP